MERYETNLDKVKDGIERRETLEPVTIRIFLEWFDMYRRTRWNVDFIDKELSKRNLVTVPKYQEAPVDSPMTFALREMQEAEGRQTTDDSFLAQEKIQENLRTRFGDDPSYKIGKLRAAGRPPVFVTPAATLLEATTKMFSNGFSQIPVMQGYFTLKGVISWKSIGLRVANGMTGPLAKDYADPAAVVISSTSIFEAIRQIVLNDYVLVQRAESNEITGIVTASDLCQQFEDISKPFLLISEIEINIRNLIENTFDADSLKDFFSNSEYHHGRAGEVKSEKLNFSDYIMILQNEAFWRQIGLKLDQASFCRDLEQVRVIRNDVMHFASDPMQESDLEKIAGMARMLDSLRGFC